MAADEAVTSHTCFLDPVWLQHSGGVRPDNALEYFERSPFFVRGEGIEFAVVATGDPRCVGIARRKRRTARVADTEASYYVLNGTIYQCPPVDVVARSRLRKCSYQLSRAFGDLRALCEDQESAAKDAARRDKRTKRRIAKFQARAEAHLAAFHEARRREAAEAPRSGADALFYSM